MERYLVTSALPYANGPIHFGHVVGAYLPADVYVRYLRMKGKHVMFVCGTDEHGVAITISAEKERLPYRAFVDHWHKEIGEIFDQFQIQFDIFSGTARNPLHSILSQHFFRRLVENKYVKTKTEKQWFCMKDSMFLADRYIEGTCPNCGAPDARGDECKQCGQWLDALALKDPHCKICNAKPKIRETTHWYLDLPKLHREGIGKWFEKKQEWKPNVKSFVANMLKDLHDRPITRDLRWGVPVPKDIPGSEGKVLYVWFDAPIGYISNTQLLCEQHPEKWGSLADWWQSSDTKLVHFIGKDNIPFHCIVFPSMLFGMRENYTLPWNVPANEFYNLQGGKFSTSGGWYIDVEDFFSKYSPDVARYALIATSPETADSEFTWEEFQRRNNGELADTIGNLASRILKFIGQRFRGIAPSGRPSISESGEPNRFEGMQQAHVQSIGEGIENFKFRLAAKKLIGLAQLGNQEFDSMQPWTKIKSDPDRCAQDIGQCYDNLWKIAVVSQPFMPQASDRLRKMLGVPDVDWQKLSWEDAKSPPPDTYGRKIGRLEILFPKIDDKQIAEEIRLLHARTAGKEQSMTPETTAEGTPQIAYEDFTKVELKIGKILSAAPVPKADRLIQLEVDIGTEKRQILAGIAKQYSCETLVGRHVVVVANLKSKKMMGIESQGMVLAATGAEGPVLVLAEKDVPPGSVVK